MRRVPVAVPIGISLVVVTVVIGSLWMLGSASGERDRFSSLEMAPKDAVFYMAINTEPSSSQWLAFNDVLETLNAKDPLQDALDEALAELDLKWERDILPLAGDEGYFAITDIERLEDGGGWVGGFQIRDEGKTQEIIGRLRERAEQEGEEFKEEEYEGVKIIYVAAPDIDGDPTTSSDCEVDENGTIQCDGEAPIPEDPFAKCSEIFFELSQEGRSTSEAPEECRPFFKCPSYLGAPDESDLEDLDGNGTPDSCDEADRIEREWQESIEFAEPYQDCADLEDISDPQCEDVPPVVIAQSAGVGGAVAIAGDVLVVGGAPEDVKPVIDVVQGRAPNALGNERLVEMREQQKDDFIFWGYANLAPVWELAESRIPSDVGPDGDSEPVETTPVETTQPPAPETGFRVPAFDADYRIEDGALQVTERITVDFGETPRHGIYRDIATLITYDYINDVIVSIEPRSVTRDGVPEPFEQPSVGGDYQRIRIGDPNVTITGEHTYEVQYIVRGALVNVESEDDNPFYDVVWNVTGNNWGVPIERASATLTIPDGSFGWTPCAVGPDPVAALQLGCSNTQDGITTMRFESQGPIEPGSGMAFMANVSGVSGAPEAVLVPNHRLDFVNEDTGDEFPFTFDEKVLDELRGMYDRAGFSISATADGFALDMSVLQAPDYEPEHTAPPGGVSDTHFADRVPADTLFYYSVNDVRNESYWQGSDPFSTSDAGFQSEMLNDFLAEFEREAGFHPVDDFLNLLTGELAVAFNASEFDATMPEFELLALSGVSDEDKIEETMMRLGDYLEREGIIQQEDGEREGVRRWTPSEGLLESVAWEVKDGNLTVGYPESALEYDDGVSGSLSDTADWKHTMDLLPEDKTSVMYVSLARLIEEIRKVEDTEQNFEESTEGKVTFDDLAAIRSVGVATTTLDDGYGYHLVVVIED